MKLIVLNIFLFISVISYGQINSIQGKIIDKKTSEPLYFAAIWSPESESRACLTAEDGEFKIDNIYSDTAYLIVKYDSHILDTIGPFIFHTPVIDTTIKIDSKCYYVTNRRSTPKCHLCNKRDKVIPIAYGLPEEEMLNAERKGELYLGGCVIESCNAAWYCIRDSIKIKKR